MRVDVRAGLLAVLAVALLGMGGCTEVENAMARVEMLNFMRESPAFDPYEAPRNAPLNAVPLEAPGGRWEPPIESTEAALRAWGDTLTNPLAMSEPVLEQGAVTYQTYCAVCHGVQAEGDGPLVGPGKLPLATNLLLPATVERTDGYIYAIIRVGRGLMPGYQRIRPAERWAVVNYVRYLQQGGEPIQVDLPGTVQPGRDQFNTIPATTAGPDTAGQE
ncbi:MAG: c-type cytochrome [Gemmatimonadota bacterium]